VQRAREAKTASLSSYYIMLCYSSITNIQDTDISLISFNNIHVGYRARLSGVFKLEMVSSGDEFFLCDDSLQWWDNMPEPKYMMLVYLYHHQHSCTPCD